MKQKIDELIRTMTFEENIQENHRLKEDLGLDSLSVISLIISLEDAFSIEFSMDDLDPAGLLTVADVYALAGRYANEESHAV